MGITVKPKPCGVFPQYDFAEAVSDPTTLDSEVWDIRNSSPADHDDEAVEELEGMVNTQVSPQVCEQDGCQEVRPGQGRCKQARGDQEGKDRQRQGRRHRQEYQAKAAARP